MNLKKASYVLLILVLFVVCGKVSAICYNKCDKGTNCYYVVYCDQLGSVTCTQVNDSYCNPIHSNYSKTYESCGSGYVTEIPEVVPKIIKTVYLVIQIAVPIVLVIIGALDFFKGISAQKEEEIKKGQQIFVKRLIYAAVVFFVFAIVKVLISAVADTTGSSILECAECFIEGKCD
jgi:hypothetical protein